jgi:hypothetical protein
VLNYTHFAFLLVFKRCMSPFIIDRHGWTPKFCYTHWNRS